MTKKRTKQDMENRRLAQARYRENLKGKGIIECHFLLPEWLVIEVQAFIDKRVQDGLKVTAEVEP